jgi:hypothetical protein
MVLYIRADVQCGLEKKAARNLFGYFLSFYKAFHERQKGNGSGTYFKQ